MRIEATIDQAEFGRLLSNFNKIKTDLKKPNLRKIFVKAAKPIADAIKAKAPKGETGKLKQSIGIIPFLGVRSGSVFVGVRREKASKKVTTWYGKILEYGSKYIPKGKFTFFEPGVRSGLNRAEAIILSELRKMIAKYAG